MELRCWKKQVYWICILLLQAFPLLLAIEPSRGKIRQTILQDLISNYSEDRVPPNFDDNVPTNVTVQLYLLSFDSITESAMEFSVSIFLRQTWKDERLQWHHPNITDHLEVDSKAMEKFWVPDLYFTNEKKANLHLVTVSNKLLHINADGVIKHSMRLSMTMSCDMLLERYPHDEQTCFISLGSYGYSRDNVIFKWSEEPIILRPGMTLPQFQITVDQVRECNFPIVEGTMIRSSYTCIEASFKLRRDFGYYMAQVYMPSILIVILSWVSFWIDFDATPARVSLSLLTVLTMTTHSSGEKAMLPRVSYLKAIDVWLSTCMFFTFAALLEYAYVNVQSRREKKRIEAAIMLDHEEHDERRTRVSIKNGSAANVTSKVTRSRLCGYKSNVENARLADKVSRVAFPFAFVVFNVCYWIYYRY